MPREAIVHLPRSSGRNSQPIFLKLLKRIRRPVHQTFRTGMDFEGILLKPGSYVAASALHPDPDYPEIPIVLECAGAAGHGRGHNRAPTLYILWRYDGGTWTELGRAVSHSWEWATDLAPIAERAIAAARSTALVEVLPAIPVRAQRLAQLVDGELGQLGTQDQVRLLATLYDLVASRLVGLYH